MNAYNNSARKEYTHTASTQALQPKSRSVLQQLPANSKQLKMQELIKNSTGLVRATNQVMQRQVDYNGKLYDGSSIYKKFESEFIREKISLEEVIELVDEQDDMSKEDLFAFFSIDEPTYSEDNVLADEETKKVKKRTSASSSIFEETYHKSKVLRRTPSGEGLVFACVEPTCNQSGELVMERKSGKERGYANRKGRKQRPPVAHDKNSPANIRISAFIEVISDMNKDYKQLMITNSELQRIQVQVEWSTDLGEHHTSHTTCNLSNKDITWKDLSASKQATWKNQVKAFLKAKGYYATISNM